MSFDLINLTSYVIAFVAIAGLAVLLAIGAGADFIARNHTVRVTRQESIPTYYANLLGAH